MPDFSDNRPYPDGKQSSIRNALFFAVFAVLSALPFVVSGAEVDGQKIAVIVQGHVSVKSDDIKLGEIAEIDAPENIAGEISGLIIAPSPKPGRQKNIRGGRLKDLIENRFPESKDIILDIPALIVVSRDSQILSEEILKEYYMNKIHEMSGNDPFEISDFRVRGKNIFPDGDIEIKSAGDSRGIRMGNYSLPVDVYVDGSKQGRLTLSGTAGKKIKILCATRDILKGSVVTADDIRVETKDAQNGSKGIFLTDPSLAIGKKVLSPVRSGAAILEKNLAVPSVLKKGDKVRLVAKAGLLSVETSGEVLSDAALGEQVKIKNIDTGKSITARVVDSTTAEAVF
ncbi:flagellar basal body P-ring formation chaperone FlgA [Desulforegula conservatrix]|uniref:flagellar basal body P-ring formation chaperone FlgA n=1 Tax=Desulforegula conservatrix TaxID=153026 RepID=UPI00040B830F|nr:flagellar basal body P-ring formation chaperone FlgA [Desulforegula conservatrix]